MGSLIGDSGLYATWGSLRSVLYGGNPPQYTSAGNNTEYTSGMHPDTCQVIKAPLTPRVFFTSPYLKTDFDGTNYYLYSSFDNIDNTVRDGIIGKTATFGSGESEVVTSAAFVYPGQTLTTVTMDPLYVASLTDWTSL